METTEKNILGTTQNNIIETTDNANQISATSNNANQKIETTNINESQTSENLSSEENSSTTGEIYQCFNDNPLISKCTLSNINNNDEIYNFLKSDLLKRYSFDNGKSFVVEGEDGSIFQVTSADNEIDLLKSNNISDDYNLSIIDFTECEALLKQEYNINENDSLIFIKQEKVTSKASEKNIRYECFEPYNKTRLNMSICSAVSINIYVPIGLSEETKNMAEQMKELGYNMFDKNDKFYNDICTPYKTTVESDILLSDRLDYIYNNEDTQCQGNCEFSDYFLGSRFINCKCNVDNNEVIEDKVDKFETKTLYQIFYYVLKYSNYKIMKCYKLVFNKNSIIKNWGSIIILILFMLYLICLITYMIKGLEPLRGCTELLIKENEKDNIKKISIFFPPIKKDKKNKSSLKGKVSKNKKAGKKMSIFERDTSKKNSMAHLKKRSSVEPLTILDKKYDRKNSKDFLKNEKIKSKRKSLNPSDLINSKKDFKDKSSKSKSKESQSELKLKENKMEKKKEKKIENKPKQLDDFELNELSYPEAIIYDKRTFFQVYLSLLKREHRILFTYFVCHDYNLIYVKLSRFIFLLATDIAMNVFFFSDVTMHRQFLNYGKYNFVQQIPQIIYSTIVSQIIEVFLCFLSLTDKHIYQIKHLEINQKNKKIILDVFKVIKIKLIVYWIFTFIFFGLYWYAVACFCAVYYNTQSAFLKDSFISFFISLVYPLILYTFPTAFRICALKCKNNSCLFQISEVIPFF